MRSLNHALVIGGAGFYGTALVHALLDLGAATTIVDTLSQGRSDHVDGAELFVGDVTEIDLHGILAERPVDVIFQLAGTGFVPASLDYPLDDLARNASTTVAVLEAARHARTPPVVAYVSSAAVYGEGRRMPMDEEHPLDPVSPYGISKLAAEGYVRLYHRLYDIPAVVIRPFSLYGPRQRKLVVYDFLTRVRGGEDPLVVAAPPEVSRDYVFVDDAAKALVTVALAAPARGEAYNFASGRPTTLAELAAEVIAACGSEACVTFTGVARTGDPLRWDGDAARARRLGAAFDTPLSVGLYRTVAWLEAEDRERATVGASA